MLGKIRQEAEEMIVELECLRCGYRGRPTLYRQALVTGGGYHIRANCRRCGGWLKFIPHRALDEEERERLPAWEEVAT